MPEHCQLEFLKDALVQSRRTVSIHLASVPCNSGRNLSSGMSVALSGCVLSSLRTSVAARFSNVHGSPAPKSLPSKIRRHASTAVGDNGKGKSGITTFCQLSMMPHDPDNRFKTLMRMSRFPSWQLLDGLERVQHHLSTSIGCKPQDPAARSCSRWHERSTPICGASRPILPASLYSDVGSCTKVSRHHVLIHVALIS